MVTSPSAIGTVKDRNRKITVHDTTIEYAGVPAIVIAEVNQTNSVASVAAVQIEATGTRRRALTLASAADAPGMPPSRENANSMRETLVTVARPHRNWQTKMST